MLEIQFHLQIRKLIWTIHVDLPTTQLFPFICVVVLDLLNICITNNYARFIVRWCRAVFCSSLHNRIRYDRYLLCISSRSQSDHCLAFTHFVIYLISLASRFNTFISGNSQSPIFPYLCINYVYTLWSRTRDTFKIENQNQSSSSLITIKYLWSYYNRRLSL